MLRKLLEKDLIKLQLKHYNTLSKYDREDLIAILYAQINSKLSISQLKKSIKTFNKWFGN